jgi:hypothetical protein
MDAKNASLISNLQQLRENLVNSGLNAQNNGNALMNAFGLNPSLPLPLGLWDNSLLNAAMYMDPSNPLFKYVPLVILVQVLRYSHLTNLKPFAFAV